MPVFMVNKPVGLFEFESTFHRAYAELAMEGEHLEFTHFPTPCRVHIVSESHANTSSLTKLLDHPQLKLASFNNKEVLLESLQEKPDVILLDVSDRAKARSILNEVRKYELKTNPETLTPVLGFTDEAQETCSLYDIGIDDRVELTDSSIELVSLIHYWGTLH